jgi:coniferyl-aldehyde dehydrogenase
MAQDQQRLTAVFQAQKQAVLRDGPPDAAVRIDRLTRGIDLLVEHQDALCDAMRADFGARSPEASRLTDIAASVSALKFARSNVRRWMRPERVSPTPGLLGLLGARARVEIQPKGVVGIMAPWNFPVFLVFAPLASVLAAGNRALIKPSELTARTSALMQDLIAHAFSPEEVAVVTGDATVGQAFSALAFDHLIFTGGGQVGRSVMAAAAQSLTPVTLELGGKCPAILSRTADLPVAAARIMNGKTLNAGQICLAPDYVLAPVEALDAFAGHAAAAAAAYFPTIEANPDYACVIADRHVARLKAYVEDARSKGARIIEVRPEGETVPPDSRKIAPTLILGATEQMTVMQEEIFGPLLPIVTYDRIEDAVDYVNSHDHPLAIYWFGEDASERDFVLGRTRSGGVTVNDVIFHVAQERLPFGGVGPSGFGSYHGRDGFMAFSHRRAVFQQIAKDIGPLKDLRPPFGPAIRKYLNGQIRR